MQIYIQINIYVYTYTYISAHKKTFALIPFTKQVDTFWLRYEYIYNVSEIDKFLH